LQDVSVILVIKEIIIVHLVVVQTYLQDALVANVASKYGVIIV
jgi:hypothetical protein